MDETEELFDRLRTIHRPEELDTYFHSRWDMDRTAVLHTDLAWEDILRENRHRSANRSASIRHAKVRKLWQWGVAASVLLLLSLVWWNWDTGSDYITYKTGFGETKNIILDDGTSVILNANSELSWKADWGNDKVRYALLQGEAYFKVAHIDLEAGVETQSSNLAERMPFQVKTSDVVIDVLGTAFNVSDRRGETQVYLENGSIKLGLMDLPANDEYRKKPMKRSKESFQPVILNSVLMKPGETVEYSAMSRKLQKINAAEGESFTEWKEGSLVYHDIDFAQMLEHLEDIYGKQFIVRDSTLLEMKVSFGLPYKDWKTVKSLMELFLQIEITPKGNDQIFIEKR